MVFVSLSRAPALHYSRSPAGRMLSEPVVSEDIDDADRCSCTAMAAGMCRLAPPLSKSSGPPILRKPSFVALGPWVMNINLKDPAELPILF